MRSFCAEGSLHLGFSYLQIWALWGEKRNRKQTAAICSVRPQLNPGLAKKRMTAVRNLNPDDFLD
jgi:hypothetical protein